VAVVTNLQARFRSAVVLLMRSCLMLGRCCVKHLDSKTPRLDRPQKEKIGSRGVQPVHLEVLSCIHPRRRW